MKHPSTMWLQFSEMLLGVVITATGISLMIKSSLGQTAITAFTQNITLLTNMKSGTIMMLFFLGCIVLQILVLRKSFEKLQLLQVVVAYVQGKVVNLICYEIPIVKDLFPNSYLGQWICILLGIMLVSYGVAVIFKADCIRNPYEELAMVLARQFHIEFSIFRVRIDVFFMVLSFLCILLFHLDFTTLREGTWVSMLLLGKSMKYTFPLAQATSLYQRKTQKLKLEHL